MRRITITTLDIIIMSTISAIVASGITIEITMLIGGAR